MKRIIFALSLLFLLSPIYAQEKLPQPPAATLTPNKVKGVTVPASIIITATDVRKKIVPIYDNPNAVLDVKFKVIGTGDTEPSFSVKGTAGSTYIEVDVPKDKESILVFTYVLYGGDKPWVSEAAETIVEWGSGLPPPTTVPPTTVPPTTVPPTTIPPTTVPPTTSVDDVFKSVKSIHAILVVDAQTANQEVAVITQNQTAIKSHIEQPNTDNKYWQYDIRATQLKTQGVTKKLVDAGLTALNTQGGITLKGTNPIVVLIDGSTQPAKMIGTPLIIPLTGNPVNTLTNMLTAIAGALKR